MLCRILIFFAVFIIGCSSKIKTGVNMKSNSEKERFYRLLDEEWNRAISDNPEWATSLGDNRFNDKLNDVSYETILLRQGNVKELLLKIKSIDRSLLLKNDKLNYDLFRQQLDNNIDGAQFFDFLIPLDQMSGIQIGFAGIHNYMPFKTRKDYANYISRMNAFPKKMKQTIDLMERGMKLGWLPPKIILSSVLEQVRAQFDISIETSPLYTPFNEFPESINLEDQINLKKEMSIALEEKVFPSYKSLYSFFAEKYLPLCRDNIACSGFPKGDDYYQYLIRHYTTTNMGPQEIHNIGVSEVKRIKGEMQRVIKRTNFDGDFDAFLEFLRTDSSFYYQTEDELLDAYRSICKKADAELPKFFGKLPRLTYGVKKIPNYQASASPTAYYYPGNNKAGRPGYFMANTYKLNTRPKYEMEALSVHEAVPGHHLQIALAQELDDIPMFRRYLGYTAFVEGWGLYSEKLAEEMGFYDDPYNKFGQLTYEMWRACRLVVDTGMHALGWTRQQAIDYMSKNTAKSKNDIKVEIDRYIAWPGQALAYKIGELKIRELRNKAEKEMGIKFDIRDFHDTVLGDGAIPLDILEKNVNQYIKKNN